MIGASVFGKVAVVYGGTSAEREVSLKSGKAVYDALKRKGVDAHAIDAAHGSASVAGGRTPGATAAGAELLRALQQGRYDRVFIALHGRGGEDGVLQGALEMLGLPYTGSGVLGSALAMDKARAKYVWQMLALPTPEFAVLTAASDVAQALQKVGLPLIVKPVHEGSTIGITHVIAPEQLRPAWKAALAYDSEVVAERYIKGAEYTAALLDNEVLPLIRIEAASGFYDFQAKYVANDTRYFCPCGLDQKREQELQQLALRAFDALGCSGWGRVDFICDAHGQPWLLEANTVPGMTDHSLVPMAARAAGMDFDTLVWRILETSLTSTRAEAGHAA